MFYPHLCRAENVTAGPIHTSKSGSESEKDEEQAKKIKENFHFLNRFRSA